MELTRRAFLSVASTALLGCAGSTSTARKDAEIDSPRAVRRLFRPPPGKVLFIAGQGAAQIGGSPAAGWGDGYLDHIPTRPGGFTDYCSIASGPDCAGLSRVADLPALKDSVLHLSVGWIDDFPPLACPKENNQLITAGAFDDNIDRLAKWCAAQPRPILMRIGFEFDRAVPFPDYHYDPAWFASGFVASSIACARPARTMSRPCWHRPTSRRRSRSRDSIGFTRVTITWIGSDARCGIRRPSTT